MMLKLEEKNSNYCDEKEYYPDSYHENRSNKELINFMETGHGLVLKKYLPLAD